MTATETIVSYIRLLAPDTDSDDYAERLEDFRTSGLPSDIPCPYSRHYCSRSVARQVGDVYVGWTFWYGGGKHGEPSAMPWLEDAYYVRAWDEVVTITRFERITDAPRPT